MRLSPTLAQLCAKGLERACEDNPALCQGVNTYGGYITYPGVAESQGVVLERAHRCDVAPEPAAEKTFSDFSVFNKLPRSCSFTISVVRTASA